MITKILDIFLDIFKMMIKTPRLFGHLFFLAFMVLNKQVR